MAMTAFIEGPLATTRWTPGQWQ